MNDEKLRIAIKAASPRNLLRNQNDIQYKFWGKSFGWKRFIQVSQSIDIASEPNRKPTENKYRSNSYIVGEACLPSGFLETSYQHLS
jgi:hypothetical protein